jgi:hypothetical protein
MSPDPKDDKFIACALAARADFVVTGNKQDFPQDQLGGTQVVSAGELTLSVMRSRFIWTSQGCASILHGLRSVFCQGPVECSFQSLEKSLLIWLCVFAGKHWGDGLNVTPSRVIIVTSIGDFGPL